MWKQFLTGDARLKVCVHGQGADPADIHGAEGDWRSEVEGWWEMELEINYREDVFEMQQREMEMEVGVWSSFCLHAHHMRRRSVSRTRAAASGC